MPIIIPDALPATAVLNRENIFTIKEGRATSQDIRPLNIAIVNLMPTKITTETQLARALSNSPLQVDLDLIRMESHEATHVSQDHMDSFYMPTDKMLEKEYDGMIITGAPVETLPFEDVDYWHEMEDIFEFAKTNVHSSMFVCWGAQAALYHYYGIKKVMMDKKLFGVFPHRVMRPHNPLVRGFDETFFAPHSRHAGIDMDDLAKHPEIRVLAESKEAGPHIMSVEEGRQIFILGHQEYDKETLDSEYRRDMDAGRDDVGVPKNYYEDDDPDKDIMFTWRAHCSLLYSNWLNYYVYQTTPYDVAKIKEGAGSTIEDDES